MNNKTILNNAFLICLSFIVAYYFFSSARSIVVFYNKKQIIKRQQKKIECLKNDITHLDHTLKIQGKNMFELERIARYDLDLGRTNELVYVEPNH